MAPHELALCTPITGKFYRHRLGQRRMLRELPFFEGLEWDDFRLTTFPAGHILGSAMLLVEGGNRSLLYTGDFKLSASATAEPANVPQAEILVMESTFGDPRYRLPDREQVIESLVQVIRQTLAVGRTPVIQAYVLGKAQELTRILTSQGFEVSLHPEMAAIARLYQASGDDGGNGVGSGPAREIPAGGRLCISIIRPRGLWRIVGLYRSGASQNDLLHPRSETVRRTLEKPGPQRVSAGGNQTITALLGRFGLAKRDDGRLGK